MMRDHEEEEDVVGREAKGSTSDAAVAHRDEPRLPPSPSPRRYRYRSKHWTRVKTWVKTWGKTRRTLIEAFARPHPMHLA